MFHFRLDSPHVRSNHHKGSKGYIHNIGFLSTVENTSKVKAVVHGIIAGVPMPFPFPQADACQNSGLACPLVSGQDYVYNTQLPISSSYPKVQDTI
jgi:Niemann-Pick C2 protein